MSKEISLAVVTPSRVLFEGIVSDVKIPALDGYMGFLPEHAPLVSPLGVGVIHCTAADNKRLYFSVSGGYFEIHENRMVVLADVAEEGLDIDLERAEKARKRALNRLNDSEAGKWDTERASVALARALTRIETVSLISGMNE